MRMLFLAGALTLCGDLQKTPQKAESSPVASTKVVDSQHLVKHCLSGNVGVWDPEEVISYCLSLGEP